MSSFKKVALCLSSFMIATLPTAKVQASELDSMKQEIVTSIADIRNENKQLVKIKKELELQKAKEMQQKLEQEKIRQNTNNNTVSKINGTNLGCFEVTAYDDTYASQGQWVGTTATGFSLSGHSRSSAMCIAVDPNIIPLGSKVLLEFDAPYEHFSGVYTAYDTGGAIKGRIIDLFMGGDGVQDQVKAFGRRTANVTIIK